MMNTNAGSGAPLRRAGCNAGIPKERKSMKQESAEKMTEAAGPVNFIFMPIERIVDQMARLNERVACRSFELYKRRGCEPGRELEDWLQAELEILRAFPAEMSDSGNQLIVHAEVRGFATEKLEVGVEPRFVLIRAEQRQPEEAEPRQSGYTAIRLSSEVDPTNVSATLIDGILVLTLTKTTSEKDCGDMEQPVGSGDVVAGSD
jgi:HSP20 family molecular chaperone IbpA